LTARRGVAHTAGMKYQATYLQEVVQPITATSREYAEAYAKNYARNNGVLLSKLEPVGEDDPALTEQTYPP
jgi:hypothetical protein